MKKPKKISERISEEMSEGVFAADMPIPQTQIVLDINSSCNAKCVFCPYIHERKAKMMKPELVYRLLEESYALGIREAQFSLTGEPLLNPNLLDYLKFAKRTGFTYTCLTTNGSEKNIRVYQNLIDAGLDSICFSIHASNRERYQSIHGIDNFDNAVSIVKQLSQFRRETGKKFLLFISSTSTRLTKNDGMELKELLGNDVDEVNYYPVLENPSRTIGMKKYLLLEEDTSSEKFDSIASIRTSVCPYPFRRLYVSVEGYLTSCCGGHYGYCNIEDLNKMSLLDAWNSPRFVEFRQRHIDHNLKNTFCSYCFNKKEDEEVFPINADLCEPKDFTKFDITGLVETRFHLESSR